MRLQIKITGPAGLGMNSTAEIIAGTFAELGYDVIGDNEYQSLIKGGINYFDLFISTGEKALRKYSDIIIAFNDKNLEHNIGSLRE
ncbi:MAG: 2-oxoacid:acceptor oxidoreductase family protein [Candidatus Peribacteria bacterium]|nr:MAG: 2-oxoacid:acceptor oxidoreductase family protein [Candidatus Peribacteria bacterium]